jgi:hypothetical protein
MMGDFASLEELRRQLGKQTIRTFLDSYPDAHSILYCHTGSACFNCPGAADETLDQGLFLHDALADQFYIDLWEHLSKKGATEKL